jgi:hypothetical protein
MTHGQGSDRRAGEEGAPGAVNQQGINRLTRLVGTAGSQSRAGSLEAFQRPLMPVRPDRVCQEPRRFPTPPGGFRMGAMRGDGT